MKIEIENREQIILLIDTFYEKVKKDPTIGFIFNEIVKVDWEHHLPVMYNFWEMVAFGSGPYKGDPMTKHIQLNRKFKITDIHFSQWLALFYETLDTLFKGDKANELKMRAQQIAKLMQFKLKQDKPTQGNI